MRTPTSSGKRSRPSKRKREKTTTSSKRTRSPSPSGPSGRRKRSTDPGLAAARVAYLGLGSNVGDRRRHILVAIAQVSRLTPRLRISSLYSTEPVGHRDQRRFWNAVVEIRWSGTPGALLNAAKEIERLGGRTPTFPGGPREIDVDVLDVDGLVRRGRDPILPHPRLAERGFVLMP